MLSRLDHIVLICRDIEAGISAYTQLLGFAPSWRTSDADFDSAIFACDNTSIELLAPSAGSSATDRIQAILGKREGALTSLAFAADNITSVHHTLGRRGLKPSNIASKHDQDLISGKRRDWSSFRCDDDACAGIKTFIVERGENPPPPRRQSIGCVESLDHIVIETPNPERAIAQYGARLGLRFALDRTIEAFHTRFLFFRIGGLTLEVIQRTQQEHAPADPDKFWGLTWAVDDLAAARERLLGHGLDVSDIRTGRKAGSQVFTLRNGSLDIPSLFIAHEKP